MMKFGKVLKLASLLGILSVGAAMAASPDFKTAQQIENEAVECTMKVGREIIFSKGKYKTEDQVEALMLMTGMDEIFRQDFRASKAMSKETWIKYQRQVGSLTGETLENWIVGAGYCYFVHRESESF